VTLRQAFIISVLMGLVALVFIVLVMFIFLPFDRLIIFATSTATITATPSVMATVILPTPMPTTTLTFTPTATNTRVPTTIPRPSKTPTPPIVRKIPVPTLIIYRTITPIPTEIALPPPPTLPSKVITPIVPLEYHVRFEAEEETVFENECTNLTWQVQGGVSITLDGKSVNASGKKKICPKRDTTYRLVVELANNSGTETRKITVKVEEDNGL